MYKGNIIDFSDRLIAHVRNTYGICLSFQKSIKYANCWFLCETGTAPKYPENYVRDIENFEQQCYTSVNFILENLRKRGSI